MKSRSIKAISIFLVLVMLAQLLPSQVFAQQLPPEGGTVGLVSENDSLNASADTSLDETSTIVSEVIENRTEFSKEFVLSNGLHMTAVYSRAVHYESNGAWEEIDNTLKMIGTGTSAVYTNTAGIWEVQFPNTLTEANRVSVSMDGYTVSFGMAGELRTGDTVVIGGGTSVMSTLQNTGEAEIYSVTSAQASTAQISTESSSLSAEDVRFAEAVSRKATSRLSYQNVYSNTHVVYDLISNKLKESVVISSYDAALRGYRYTLNTGSLIPILNQDNSIDLYNESKTEIVFTMPAPFMVDNANEYCDDVEVMLVKSGNSYILSYLLPTTWLASEERVWPVVLDPVITEEGSRDNIQDQTVAETDSPSPTTGVIQCGWRDYTGIMRFFLKYESLPNLTSADVIVDAQMGLYKAMTSVEPVVVTVHKVLGTWEDATLTWNNKPDFDGTIEDYYVSQAQGIHYWNVTDIVRGWYETGQNNGMMFKAVDSSEAVTSNNFRQYYSSDYDRYSPELWPGLMITFRNSNGLENYWDYTASNAGRAGTGYVNNYSGNLTWIHNDLGFSGNRVPVSISHIYNTNDSGLNTFGLGYGWRTNFNQTVKVWEKDSSYYVWEDGDGSKHYFKYDQSIGKYKDEDGLELVLTLNNGEYQITDKQGNINYFDGNGRLYTIENNQQTHSNIRILYTSSTGGYISQIIDGAGRKYNFTYTNNLLERISYTGAGATEIAYVSFGYSGSNLTSVTDQDGKSAQYGYTGNLLTSAQDVDGYKLSYTYSPGLVKRVVGIAESDGNASGNSLTIEYADHQTTFTDHNGNIQIMQFNNWGNTVSIQDGLGRAQFAQYEVNKYNETDGKGNQLLLSSKLQNSVGSRFNNSSFEAGASFSVLSGSGSYSLSTQAAYHGNQSMTLTNDLIMTTVDLPIVAGNTETFSAYVKTVGTTARLEFYDGTNTYVSETLPANSDWTKIQVTYANTGSATARVRARVRAEGIGTTYVDCVQWERAETASRYNLVTNGDFRTTGYWSTTSGRTSVSTSAGPELSTNVYQMVGSPTSARRIDQTIPVNGVGGDTFVLSGWAKGNSVPLSGDRQFAIIGTFNYTDGSTSAPFAAQFNTATDSSVNWQYAAQVMVAEKAYSSIKVEVAYDYNANTVYFDGIQLYKEEFGTSYTYDDNGNITSVTDLQKQATTYEFDQTTNDLLRIIQDGATKMAYTYDSYHNVLTATTAQGVVYRFTYDTYGNNTMVEIVNGDQVIKSTATYSTDGNTLLSTKDALDKETTYGYNVNTNVLEWVKYPNDTDATRTEYTYDSMYRLASAVADTSGGVTLTASCTYTDDMLTAIQTGSTTYSFTYGDFAQRSSVSIGSRNLATYHYTNDQNRYLGSLVYGNNDSVTYTYDSYGRVVLETYEDGSTVSYAYGNDGALATVTDSETGIKTTYYYDLTDRLMKYVESGNGHSHSVGYEYDNLNNLSKLVETINGTTQISTYTYDADNRITGIDGSVVDFSYDYDSFGRLEYTGFGTTSTNAITRDYYFKTAATGAKTSQVSRMETDTSYFTLLNEFAYDNNGNLTSVDFGTSSVSYAYDSANQLIRENNSFADRTWVWTYDDAGNILSRSEYAYTTGTLGAPLNTVTYSYGDAAWGDLLTAYGGQGISYDTIGNPLLDGTWTYSWKQGRQLATMTGGGVTWTYTYDANGMRKTRSNSSTTYSYVYNDNKLSQMTVGGNTLTFTYDANGAPAAVTYNGTVYYYLTTLQSDVLMILDTNGQPVAEYTYDAWGRIHEITGSMAATLGQINPLRYRGYVYDQETGLYYLNSRYYNPQWGRFLNADAFAATGQGLLGNNMFAYCRNNPVCRVDITGMMDMSCLDDEHDKDLFPDDDIGYVNSGTTSNGSQTSGSHITVGISGNSWGYSQAPKQGIPGYTYTQVSSDGRNIIVSHTTYNEHGLPGTRVDYVGRSHSVGLPHIHRYSYNAIGGKIFRSGEIVEAYFDE